MAAPSITNTMTSGTTALAAEMNTNFQDLIDGVSDGTKDLTINQMTADSTVTMSGTTLAYASALTSSSDPIVNFQNTSKWTVNTITELDLAACQKIDMGGANIGVSISPDNNTLYPQAIPKAYGHSVVLGSGSCGAISTAGGAFNFAYSASSWDVSSMAIQFRTPMQDADYSIVANYHKRTGAEPQFGGIAHLTVISQTVSGFVVLALGVRGILMNFGDSGDSQVYFAVFGNQ